MSWHAGVETLSAYAIGTLDDALAMSTEAHLSGCAPCRTALSAFVEPERIERVWSGVRDTVDAPRRSLLERMLVRGRVPENIARLLAATPSLSASWLLAVAVVLGFAVAAAHTGPAGQLVFLVVAPLLPLAGVAAAYGPGLDPAFEMGAVTPMQGPRLLLFRSCAVLVVTFAFSAAAATFLPRAAEAAAWLLPALGLTVSGLALGARIGAARSAASLAGAWVLVTVGTAVLAADELAVFRGRGQAAFVVVTLVALSMVVLQRERFEIRRSL